MPKLLQKVEVATENGSLTGVSYTNIPVPSTYGWGKKDISDPKAGRTAGLRMKKMLRGKARVLQLTWKGRSYTEIATAFTIFDHEYFYVTYWDARTNTAQRKFFYAGDMSASSWTATKDGIWEIASVDLIQAQPDL